MCRQTCCYCVKTASTVSATSTSTRYVSINQTFRALDSQLSSKLTCEDNQGWGGRRPLMLVGGGGDTQVWVPTGSGLGQHLLILPSGGFMGETSASLTPSGCSGSPWRRALVKLLCQLPASSGVAPESSSLVAIRVTSCHLLILLLW